MHAVLAALANPRRRLFRLYATPERRRELGPAIAAALARAGREVETVERDRREIDLLAGPGSAHQGLVLEAAPLAAEGLEGLIARAEGSPRAVAVVLDQVTDPQNVGAIARSAAAFGAVGLVLQERHAPPETGALAKAACGALEHLALARVANLAQALAHLKEAGFWVVGLEPAAAVALAEAGLSGRIALVLGAEGPGLRRLTRERCDLLARLPLAGPIPSLNVSAAAAAALYELFRGVPVPRPPD